jgi:shikimate dehydrogenase
MVHLSGKTRVLGVIGHPVEHTSSPAMHNAAIAALGLDYVYAAFPVRPEALGQAIAGMRALQVRGLNVTVPHKVGVMALLDELSPEARAIGAVNTIDHCEGRLIGHNTDAFGIMESLRVDGGLEILPARIALLGAGGAARAILYALLLRPEVEHVALLNRTPERASALAADLDPQGRRVQPGALDGSATGLLRDAGLLINSTSIGMHPHPNASPLPDPSCLHAGIVVLDIVYNPLETLLLRQARTAGARPVDGLGMLARQGARAFTIWTDVEPPVEVMRAAALERLGKPAH